MSVRDKLLFTSKITRIFGVKDRRECRPFGATSLYECEGNFTSSSLFRVNTSISPRIVNGSAPAPESTELVTSIIEILMAKKDQVTCSKRCLIEGSRYILSVDQFTDPSYISVRTAMRKCDEHSVSKM